MPSNGHGISLSQNPRFSTASTSSAASNEQTNGNKSDGNRPVESQLVIAQVHHDPIVEKKHEESTKGNSILLLLYEKRSIEKIYTFPHIFLSFTHKS